MTNFFKLDVQRGIFIKKEEIEWWPPSFQGTTFPI